MEKVITLFKRDMNGNRQVYDEVAPGAEWVIAGEGSATRKWNGTCCLVRDGKLYKRYTFKQGRSPSQQPPANFEAVSEPDPRTGKQEGWVPVGGGPEDKWHREAWDHCPQLSDGTHELIGPKVQGGADDQGGPPHVLVPHGEVLAPGHPPRHFSALKIYFEQYHDIEGIVWHHPDGRMVKIKGKDFGINRAKT